MIMSKNNGSLRAVDAVAIVKMVEEAVKEVVAEVPEPVVLTIVKPEPVIAPRKLTLDERIQKV